MPFYLRYVIFVALFNKMHHNSRILKKTTDEHLLSLLRKNDKDAFTIIYERYHKRIYIIAFKYLKDQELTKDAVQHIFLKLWEYRSLQKINISLKNYLFTMIKNHVLNEIRNNTTALEKIYELSQNPEEATNEFIDTLEKQDMTARLYEAINNLPEQKKNVCLYKLKENLSNQDIAEKMQISVPTVKTHYSEAIKALRKHFRYAVPSILYLLIKHHIF